MGRGIRFLILICGAVTLAMPAGRASEMAPRGVLIVDEFGPDSPFARLFRQQIHSTLDREKVPLHILYSESLDTARFDSVDYENTLTTYFAAKYRNRRVDAIVALGLDSLTAASRLRAQIWPGADIVFATVGEESNIRSLALSDTTGVILTRRFQDLLEYARLVVPKLAQLVLVGDPIERQSFREQYKEDLQQVAKSMQVTNLTGLSLTEAQARVANLPGDSAIIYLPFRTDNSGIIHNPTEAFEALVAVANRPIIVDTAGFVGIGATGGVLPSAEDLGQEVASKVARILNGEAASHIPITVTDEKKQVLDWRQLQRWGVSDAAIPLGSEIQFRQLTLWDLYRWQIAAIALVILIQGIAIAWLVYEHRKRRSAEAESHQHLLEVTKMDRAMIASAMSTSISHELSQPLGAILSNAEAAEMMLDAESLDRDELKEILADIRRDDQRAVGIIKHLRMLLKQSELAAQDFDLGEALNDAVKILKPTVEEYKVALEIKAAPTSLRVRADPIHVQQVVLNLAMNAIDAMQGIPTTERKLMLGISQVADEILVSVEDTGTGIPDDKLNSIFKPFVTTKSQGTGLGLSIARTIVATYGGKIWAENRAEGGAAFRFTLQRTRAAAA